MSVTKNNWSSGIQVGISGKIARNIQREGMQKVYSKAYSPRSALDGGHSSQHLYVISEYHFPNHTPNACFGLFQFLSLHPLVLFCPITPPVDILSHFYLITPPITILFVFSYVSYVLFLKKGCK